MQISCPTCLGSFNKRQTHFLTSLSSHFVPLPQANDISHSPGDYLKPGEDEIDGLKRRLDERLAPPSSDQFDQITHGIDNDWEIGDCLAQWWRPNFETFMVNSFFRTAFFSDPLTAKPYLSLATVPIRSCAYKQTQRMQKIIRCADA